MATKYSKGQAVKIDVPPPEGPVIALRMDEEGNFFYLVEWTDNSGAKQQRWFEESQLTAA